MIWCSRRSLAAVGLAGLTSALVLLAPGAARADDPSCFGLPALPPLGTGGVTIVATGASEVLVGTFGDDVIDAGGGDDVVCGLGGNDIIIGGPGTDLIAGNAGNDDLAGWAGDDRIVGGPGDDTLKGNQDDDDLRSGEGRDLLIGGPGDDYLHGGSGDDRLNGYTGNDECQAWTGVDQQINCERYGPDIERSPFVTTTLSPTSLLSLASSAEDELTARQQQSTLDAALLGALPAFNEGDPVPPTGVTPSELLPGDPGYTTTGDLAVETGDATPSVR